MRSTFLGLTADLPDDWNDESTITFTIPAIDTPDGQSLSPGNIVINWMNAEGAAPKEYLADLQAQLANAFERFEVLEAGDMGDAPFVRFKFEAGRDLQQMLVVRRVGERMVIVTGTAIGEYFDRYRKQFESIARSLRAA